MERLYKRPHITRVLNFKSCYNLVTTKPEAMTMAQTQTYEGTLEQLVQQLSKLPNTRKYKITVTPDEPATNKASTVIPFGIFPQLQSLTEEDFKSAEWR